jgi:hypothetical protein
MKVFNWARALAPLCGTLIGVMVYANYFSWWWLAVLGIIGLLAVILGRLVVARRPRLAAIILTPWILFGMSLLATVTIILLWAALHSATIFPYVTADAQKELASALTGALTVFFAVVFTKDLEEGGGFFWPGTHFKAEVSAKFSEKLKGPTDFTDTEVSDAVVGNSVRGNGTRKKIEGWGLRARLVRAGIIKVSFLN